MIARYNIRYALAIVPALAASTAHAGVSFQAQAGSRVTTYLVIGGNKQDLAASEQRLSLHWQPWQAPISFGAAYSQMKWKDDFDIKGSEFDLDTKAWYQFKNRRYTLYGKAAYTFSGRYQFNSQPIGPIKPRYLYKPSGYRVAAGALWSLVPAFGILCEVDKGGRNLKFTSIEDAGEASVVPGAKIKIDSLSFLIGIQIGS